MINDKPGRSTLQRWYRYFKKADWWNTDLRGKLHLSLRNVLRPAIALVRAIQYSGQYGTRIPASYSVSRWQQIKDLWWFRTAYDLDPGAYYSYELYREERKHQAHQYFDGRHSIYLFDRFVERTSTHAAQLLGDKRRFDEHCQVHDLPTVPVYFAMDAGGFTGRAWTDCTSLPRQNLFVKPACGQQGKGVVRWRYQGDGRYAWKDTVLRNAELIQHLKTVAADQPLIVQPTLNNHTRLKPFSEGGLCTIRMITGRTPEDVAHHLFSVFKMPRGDTVTDNTSQGGGGAPVDAATGRLGQAKWPIDKVTFHKTIRHPDTGALIEGTVLPDWKDAIELVQRAHNTLPDVAFVGWDVALIEEGPLLLEGNTTWGVDSIQAFHEEPLGTSEVATYLDQHMRRLASQ